MSLLSQKFKFLRKKEVSPNGHQITEDGGREWENYYRDRWSYDKVVRTTHGVNCTGSCSWNIYVKNGVVAWESGIDRHLHDNFRNLFLRQPDI